ncbi:MAG TPA: lysylphosphatidylglycerol synthase transmembrane domain-containing protein [Candidatus Saccharimonadales bacterium]|nr:lysylphosphatidylglycerol synthase transmembrane domain-containing protein [Candidatus Saccharimonadales bacterium]
MAEKLGSKWRKVITTVTFLALLLLVYFSRQEIGDTFTRLSELNIIILLIIIAFQYVNHYSYAKLYQSLFRIVGKKLKYWPMFRISLEVNFVNNIFPTAGLTGFSYFGLRMQKFDINAGKSTLVQMMRWVGVFLSFQVLTFFGLLSLAVEGKVNNFTILVASSLVTLIVVGTVLLTYIVGSRQRIDSFFTWITKAINRVIQVVRPKHPETINIASSRQMFLDLHQDYNIILKNYRRLGPWFVYSLLANTVEIASIYVIYLAFGDAVNPGAIILSYIIASFAGVISVLPGGVGIYEGLMVAVLATAGVSPGVSIPATVMYRVLTSIIQLPPGYYFYQKALDESGWEKEKAKGPYDRR